jgi:hypothetical protein
MNIIVIVIPKCNIFSGPVQDENGIWRIRKNHELNELIGNADIIRFIKSRRMAWL